MPVKNPGYAYKTDVEITQSRAEIEAQLGRAGAGQIVGGWDRNTRSGFIIFALGGKQYRLDVPQREYGHREKDQVDRERWRALLLIVKARLELVRAELSTVEVEFLPHMMLPNGKPVAEVIMPAIEKMYEDGQMRPLLPGFNKQLGEGS